MCTVSSDSWLYYKKKTGGILWSKTFQDQIIEQFYKNSAMKMILLDSQDAFLGL